MNKLIKEMVGDNYHVHRLINTSIRIGLGGYFFGSILFRKRKYKITFANL